MITYSKSLNLYPIFTGIALILALVTGYGIISYKKPMSRACFFVGNGAYYALRAEDSYDNPPAFDSFKSAKEFVNGFSPDSVFSDFTRALFEKEQNIFATYKTWSSFVHLINRIKGVFADFGITKPLEQIYIDNKAQLPEKAQKVLVKNLIAPGYTPNQCYNIDVIPLYHPLLFYGPTAQELAHVAPQERFDAFKEKCGLLHPYFSRLFHFLLLFNPSEWRMYDTHAGFYYFTPRNAHTTGVNITGFTQLDPAAAYETEPNIACTIHEDDWAFHMDQLFTSSPINWQVYLTGHGSVPIQSGNQTVEEDYNENGQRMTAWIGGIPGKKFKPFLEYLDKNIHTEKLFLSSCHVPAKRLLQLAEKALSYKIISPIATYDTVTCYVPCGYITSYIPAWLTSDQKMELNYTLKPSESDACTPLNIPKYSSLLSVDSEEKVLRKHIDTFVKAKAFEAPSMIDANSTKVERLTT